MQKVLKLPKGIFPEERSAAAELIQERERIVAKLRDLENREFALTAKLLHMTPAVFALP